jgi:DNA (cytosine-5)-methyltransferase 1
MKLVVFHKLGENRNSPRFWLESRRLDSFGFSAGTAFSVQQIRNGVRFTPEAHGTHHVSQRRAAGRTRPIIDLASRAILESLAGWAEVRVDASHRVIEVRPSVRAFSIRDRLRAAPPFQTLEIFCGGGTLSAAIADHRDYQLVAGVEVEAKFADVWQASHPAATLFQADVRRIHPSEYPAHDVLIAAIPCTSHSMLGRARKALAGRPELGDSGDLFLCIAELVATRLPLACVFENVPSFATSLAGLSLSHHLRQMGYHVTETILDPHAEWNEPQDRRRWLMVATLRPGFVLESPAHAFVGDLSAFLDSPSEQDRADAQRIAGSIAALRRHRDRHRVLGHGFGFSTISAKSHRVPTLVRSYHKINVGPFVETAHGPRLLRKHEVEKLMGCTIACEHYATAIEILGQGVQTRVFKAVLSQLAEFLSS